MRTKLLLVFILIALATIGCSSIQSSPAPSVPLTSQLAALRQLPLPAGVNPSVWAELKAALAAQLSAPGFKTASTPSTRDPARVWPTYDETTHKLSWYFQNPGDYDQNGEVNIGDLTPLGIHFGEQVPNVPSFLPSSLDDLLDTNNSSAIDIGDVTAIGQNYGNRIDSFNVYASTNFDDVPEGSLLPSLISPLISLPISAASGNRGKERLFYEVVADDPSLEKVFWVRPAGDGAEGAISVPEPFRMKLTVFGDSKGVPAAVGGLAIPSRDASGWSWDIDGDGNFDVWPTAEFRLFAGEPRQGLIVTQPGEHSMTARAGLYAGILVQKTVTYNIGEGPDLWRDYVIDAAPEASSLHAGLVIADGFPLVVYDYVPTMEVNQQMILSRRATDALGTAWGEPGTVVPSTKIPVGTFDELDLVGGLPTLIWKNPTDGLMYQSASNPQASAWDPPLLINPQVGIGIEPTLLDLGGVPQVLFCNELPYLLQIIHPAGLLTDPWTSELTAGTVSALGYGEESGFELVNGVPAIAWLKDTGNYTAQVEYMRRSPGEQEYNVATIGYAAHSVRMAVIGGLPALAWGDYADPPSVYYSRALDENGSAWSTPVVVGPFALNITFGRGMDLASIGGLPAIISMDKEGRYWYFEASDAAGSSWKAPVGIMCAPYSSASLYEVQGHPAVLFCGDAREAFPGSLVFSIRY